MTAPLTGLRGTLTAAAFFLDPAVIGVDEARRRVLDRWQPGCRLLHALDGWLLVLADPVPVRASHAPGQPIGVDDVGPHSVELTRFGVRRRLELGELRDVAMTAWLRDAGLRVHRLQPCDRPVPEPEVVDASVVVAEPDLRSAAGLTGRAPTVAEALGPPLTRLERALGWVLITLVVAAVIALIVVLVRHVGSGSSAPAPRPSSSSASPTPTATTVTLNGRALTIPNLPAFSAPRIPTSHSTETATRVLRIVIIAAVAGAFWSRLRRGRREAAAARRTARPASADGSKPREKHRLLGRLLFRSGASRLVSRKQTRYVRELTDQFENRRWDDALRRAIALDSGRGAGAAAVSLRLPRARTQLRFGPAGTGGTTFLGTAAYLHLRELYRTAAKDLEAAGRAAEAAFVYGELLHDTLAAIAVLEKAGLMRTAAELAAARDVDPAFAVRLWWRAGDRERAVDLARARGAFAAGVERLAQVDASAARALRAAWVGASRAAGDTEQAFRAAWPDRELRELVAEYVLATSEHPDALPDAVLAQVVAASGDEGAATAALARFDGRGHDTAPARDRLTAELHRIEPADFAAPAQDRRLSGAALLAALRDGGTPAELSGKQSRRLVTALSRRADPLLAADLPPINRRSARDHTGTRLTIGDVPGTMPVTDAAVLPDARLLVAAGTRGLSLLSSTGALATHWDRPVDRIVLADNAASALLMHVTGPRVEIARLDLGTGRIAGAGTIIARHFPDSYDGGILTVADGDGIALLDVLSGTPRLLWRELSAAEVPLALGRTHDRLVALVRMPAGDLHLCRWDVPGMTMRLRHRFELDAPVTSAAVVPDEVLLIDHQSVLGARLRRVAGYRPVETVRTKLSDDVRVTSSGTSLALHQPGESGGTRVRIGEVADPRLEVRCPQADPVGVRSSGALVTVWAAGCVLGYDTTTDDVVASARL